MDLAVYISELLGQQGEVNVPGMGNFAQIRVNGYFNEQEKKFYPPSHEVSFKPQSTDSDELAVYIAGKKNISLASSKYFIDKYVITTKQDAETKEVEVEGLGYLYKNGAMLAFKADSKKVNDPEFFGLPPVKIPQPGDRPEPVYTPPVKEEVKVEPVVQEEIPVKEVQQEIVQDVPTVIEDQEEYEEEYVEEEPRRRVNTAIILLMFIIIVILGLTGLYIYKPSIIEQFINKIHKEEAVKAPVVVPLAKKDSVVKTAAVSDSAAKTTATLATTTPPVTQASVIDSTKSRFEIMAGSFRTQKAADLSIKAYKSLGIDAKVVTDAPGRRIHLSIGTFATRQEAEAARINFIKTKRVSKDIYPLEIKAKK